MKMQYLIKFSNKLENVRYFEISANSLFVTDFNSVVAIDNQETIVIKDFNSTQIYCLNEMLISECNFYYDLATKTVETFKNLGDKFYTGITYNDILLFTSDCYTFYSHKDEKIIYELPHLKGSSIRKMNEAGNLYYSKNGFHLNNTNRELVWEFNFSDLIKANNDIQISGIEFYQNKIFFYMFSRSTDDYALVVLDCNSGKTLYESKEPMTNLRLQEDKVYSLREKGISIMDANDYTIKKIDSSKVLSILDYTFEEILDTGESWGMTTKYFEFSPHIYSVNYPYLYFAQNRGTIFGVFNLESELLLWHRDLEIDNTINPVIARIEVSGDMLYVHCSDNTLHIYEVI